MFKHPIHIRLRYVSNTYFFEARHECPCNTGCCIPGEQAMNIHGLFCHMDSNHIFLTQFKSFCLTCISWRNLFRPHQLVNLQLQLHALYNVDHAATAINCQSIICYCLLNFLPSKKSKKRTIILQLRIMIDYHANTALSTLKFCFFPHFSWIAPW